MNTTVITSKGTTTIPKEFRDNLGLREGTVVSFEMSKSGRLYIEPMVDIADLRAENKKILLKNKQNLKNYKSGDGFMARAKASIK